MPRPDPVEPQMWVAQAQNGEQGDFCDLQSEVQYDNTDELHLAMRIDSAMQAGTEPVIIDDYTGESDTRWNIYVSEQDGQGNSTPIRYGPGR